MERHPDITDVTINQTDQEIIKYYPSDVKVDGNFSLDGEDSEDINISDITVDKDFSLSPSDAVWIHAIYILGNLTVEGNITNYDGDTGSGLFVQGITKAENIFSGGSHVHLHEVYVKGFCLGFYNGGQLNIANFNQGILVSVDHHTNIEIQDSAIGFSDDGIRGTHPMDDFYTIFKNKEWFEKDDDEFYFLDDEFMADIRKEGLNYVEINLAIEKFKQNIANELASYETLEITKIKKIKAVLNKKVANMRHSGYDYRSVLEDLNIKPKNEIKIIKGPHKISGDFCIDRGDKNIKALFIDGDLIVDGTIFNHFKKKPLKIFVLGDVICNHFLVQSTNFIIKGKLDIKNLFLYDNPSATEEDEDSELAVGPGEKISCKIALFNNDVNMWSYFNSKVKHIYSNYLDVLGSEALDFKDLDHIIKPEFLSNQDDEVVLNVEKIITQIIQNKQGIMLD